MNAKELPGTVGTEQLTSTSPANSKGRARSRQRQLVSWNGQHLRDALVAATALLSRQRNYINSLNVFPVPDGDTGTNMFLTMQEAVKDVAHSPSHSAGEIAAAVSHSALMGARGNSGVILSQILRGVARALKDKETFTAADFAVALREASNTAYKAVVNPVEGTILTVARETAEAAEIAAKNVANVHDGSALFQVLQAAHEGARASVARTPTLLATLREAGVVDAGGQGYAFIIEGLLRYMKGESSESNDDVHADGNTPLAPAFKNLEGKRTTSEEDAFGYCTNFMVQGQDLDFEKIRSDLSALGQSAVIVGDEKYIKVHIHTLYPGKLLEYATPLGILRQIKIDNMDDQHEEFMAAGGVGAHADETEKQGQSENEPIGDIATIVVAAGEGIEKVFHSLGATRIVKGGQTMNPSTQELLHAVESVPTDKVIILPNNHNILLAANQVKALTKKEIEVIPTDTVPQGIAALVSLNYDTNLADNAKAMIRAMEAVQTAEITTAVRTAQINGVDVQAGQCIGILNGKLASASADKEQVIWDLLAKMKTQDYELVTIYFGNDVQAADAQKLMETIQVRYNEQQVELVCGNQPHYDYIISAE